MKKALTIFTLFVLVSCNENFKSETIYYEMLDDSSYSIQKKTRDYSAKEPIDAYKLAVKHYKVDSIISSYDRMRGARYDSLVEFKFYDDDNNNVLPRLNQKLKDEIDADALLYAYDVLDTHMGVDDRLKEIEDKIKNSYTTSERYENHLSNWDGSLPELVDMVEESLHNPDSFEHIKTGFKIHDDWVEVRMDYRAENGYGALRKASIIVETDASAKITNVLAQKDY